MAIPFNTLLELQSSSCIYHRGTATLSEAIRQVTPRSLTLRVVGHLCAHALLLHAELRSKLGAEIRCLEHPANLDFGVSLERIRAAFDPFDRLLQRLHLKQPEARDQLLSLREGPVDDDALRS